MVGYVRQSAGTILTGNTIQASDFNNEYNALENAFGAVSGHNHDGTTGGGAKIPTAGLGTLTNTSAGIIVADGANGYVVRTLTAPAAGITITNGNGVSGNPTLVLANDLAAVEGLATNGMAVRTGTSTWTTRSITAGANISVSNGDGVAGAPTIALTGIGSAIQAYDATLDALAAYNTNGLLTQTSANTFTGRTLTGTTNRITITNGDGVSGNPTVDISSSYVGQSTITTLGTIGTGVWQGTAVGIGYGGTGQTTANASFNALAPSQATHSGKYLTTNGTDTSWSTVSALADSGGNGVVVRTSVNTTAARTITAGANITVTNGTGVSGNPTIAVTNAVITVKRQVFTSSGTYTPSTGMLYCDVEVVGGGGGGGGSVNADPTSAGGGGGAGGYARKIFTAADIGASKTVTIGAAGTGGAVDGNGGTGGTSSVGSLISATGGTGGQFAASGGGGPPGTGGNGSLGNINILGGEGVVGSTTDASGGTGGASFFGGGGAGTISGAGRAGAAYGSGGGGGGGAAYTGGAGAAGVIIVTEFCSQ